MYRQIYIRSFLHFVICTLIINLHRYVLVQRSCYAICIAALVMLTGTAHAAEKQEEIKTLHKMKTENGVSVRIVGSRGGRERVLMDCEYDAPLLSISIGMFSSNGLATYLPSITSVYGAFFIPVTQLILDEKFFDKCKRDTVVRH